jgi:hypothetical protein
MILSSATDFFCHGGSMPGPDVEMILYLPHLQVIASSHQQSVPAAFDSVFGFPPACAR